MKFIKEPEGHDKNRIEFNSVSVTLPEILEDFKCFLMACGYPVDFADELAIIAADDEINPKRNKND
jgi:hypothetical protein